MIVIGVDAHKRSQTLVAVEAGAGELLGQRTALASDDGALEALRFGRAWMTSGCGRSRIAGMSRDASSKR
jgi:hypothetical protein